jgi:acyl-CoA reductase-like NAD-dependent aldehyde dehydrogenase
VNTFPFWVDGKPVTGTETVEVHSPYDGRVVGRHSVPTAQDVEQAVASAAAVAGTFAALPAYRRAAALEHVSRRITERADEIAALITAESGKPLIWSQAEVARGVSTFRWAAEEARRFTGTMQRLDTDAGGTGRTALVRRVPRGPVLGITPFNFPLNLVAHKAAPALAVGAPIVLKPAPATPLTSLLLGELLAETDLPVGSWSVLPTSNEVAARLVADPRLPVVSFTGSVPVGWGISDAAPRKHVTLELGGNAAVVISPDWTDLEFAAKRVATFSMYQAGQSCISVQRVFVHRDHYQRFRELLLAEVGRLGTGDPALPGTSVGPLINQAAADRVRGWVAEAVDEGATLLTGGGGAGTTVEPTVLAEAAETSKVLTEEVFGPVVVVNPVDSVDEAFEAVNSSRFGLQAGVFTTDLNIAFQASATLAVGGVIIGDVPSYRADQMPYGGVKDSGVGREGPAAAMDDLTEPRVTVLTGLPVV